MELNSAIILSTLLYKILSLSIGAMFGFWGYRLFTKNVWGKSGDMQATYGKASILLKAAAPGIFFALFGAAIIIFTLHKGLTLEPVKLLDKPVLPNIGGK